MAFCEPKYRVTIREGQLLLASWNRALLRRGTNIKMASQRGRDGVMIADLYVDTAPDGPELIVAPIAEPADHESARIHLEQWATALGYRRLWFPEEIREARTMQPAGAFLATCDVCRSSWRADQAALREGLERAGLFPNSCLLCGCQLLRWHPGTARSTGATVPARAAGSA